ncbi:hypothetical protein JCM17845_29390 [Iodidimonas gelatinilytica]|uniref:Uncharacterized protein n=1 Tax=Iodidimonas gelatinilytica TaxID=1236966 RepID=A0A5A7N5M7_9PROT|nr:hypothetical protein [Iodidimonas gelatinilytica]GER02316.1 hypothetical protein JCM17845_29390 [Iodidimonas gelatinilytica]
MTTMNQQVNELVVKDLTELWDGRLPTWDEFKEASHEGRVRVNKTVAAQAIHWKGIPTVMVVLYGIITIWAAFLLTPVMIGLYFFDVVGGWWILGGVFGAWLLLQVSRDGQCEGIKMGAERNEALYSTLVANGAFLFPPSQ